MNLKHKLQHAFFLPSFLFPVLLVAQVKDAPLRLLLRVDDVVPVEVGLHHRGGSRQ